MDGWMDGLFVLHCHSAYTQCQSSRCCRRCHFCFRRALLPYLLFFPLSRFSFQFFFFFTEHKTLLLRLLRPLTDMLHVLVVCGCLMFSNAFVFFVFTICILTVIVVNIIQSFGISSNHREINIYIYIYLHTSIFVCEHARMCLLLLFFFIYLLKKKNKIKNLFSFFFMNHAWAIVWTKWYNAK